LRIADPKTHWLLPCIHNALNPIKCSASNLTTCSQGGLMEVHTRFNSRWL
jgi:hypothetical protein